MTESMEQSYIKAFRGSFLGMLRWEQLDRLWDTVRSIEKPDLYIYAIGETPPQAPASREQLHHFIQEVDILLHKEHDEDYCGIVYVDNPDAPAFIKIFDPNNLGVSCGFSDNPPLPGWILCTLAPVDLNTALAPPGNRRRWWRRLFGAD